MCGILGSFSKNTSGIDQISFGRALKKLSFRGPDNQLSKAFLKYQNSTLFLGHTRLSILDLSSAGSQPMTLRDESLTITFNGEIYNYKELRLELKAQNYVFETETDTEVLLKAYQCWGLNCLRKLIGMFSFCIFDHKKKTLTLVRDAFGIKPLFYSLSHEMFIFGSEINPLVDLLQKNIEPDLQTAYYYLVHGIYGHSERTFFKNIKNLSPGTYIEYDLKTSTLSTAKKWWQPKINEEKNISFKDAAQILKEKFLNNIKLHLRSDVPLGAALSGGVDSSAIVCAMRILEPSMPIHTFSYIAENSPKSEKKWIDIVNQHTSAIPHQLVSKPSELLSDLDDLIASQGEPFGSTSIYAQYRVCQLTREKGITVTLEGQGADELLAGYVGYPGERLLSLFENKQYKDAFSFAREWAKFPDRSYKQAWMYFGKKVLPDSLNKIARSLLGRNFEPTWLNLELFKSEDVILTEKRMIKNIEGKGRRVKEQLAYSLEHLGLPSLLRHGDRNSMRFSVESRVPFLTIDMAEFLYSLPEDFLISKKGETKYIFREAMKDILPKAIINRKDKIGFEADSVSWKKEYLKSINNLLNKSKNSSAFHIHNLKSYINQDSTKEISTFRILNYLKWNDIYFN